MSYFSQDRIEKYGYGLLRLALVVCFSFAFDMRIYLASYRWIGHIYIGTIGAVVNVRVLAYKYNIFLLLVAGIICLVELRHDYAVVVYLVKTLGGDYLAGKVDTKEWKHTALAFCVVAPLTILISCSENVLQYAWITFAMFLVQLICEVR